MIVRRCATCTANADCAFSRFHPAKPTRAVFELEYPPEPPPRKLRGCITGYTFRDSGLKTKSQTPVPHCTRTIPLPLLPSGPGGIGGVSSRGPTPDLENSIRFFSSHA